MLRSAPHTLLKRLWAQDAGVMSTRVGLVLAAIMAACWHYGRLDYVMPMFLGVIASGIGDTDDGWRGRLRTVLITLVCFALAAATVGLLFDRHWAFAAALCAAAFVLTMLGAVSERYRAIAWATLVLSIYSATGMEARGDDPRWLQPVLLLSGAVAYSALSVAWARVFALHPVRRRIAQVYGTLAEYLWLKAAMFEPIRGVDMESRRIALAHRNVDVVQALNLAKDALLRRLPPVDPLTGVPPDAGNEESRLLLAQYFIAQDVHERASSSHVAYAELADAFFHSDVMFRCQRTLALQGSVCAELAQSIGLRRPWKNDGSTQQALADLHGALSHLEARDRRAGDAPDQPPRRGRQLRSLHALAQNLGALDQQLATADAPAPASLGETLFDSTPRTLREALARVRAQCRLKAPTFRHAVRLALALAASFAVLSAMHAEHGYWVLLTTLFVCQPSYGATRRRVLERIAGTFCGLVAGWAVLGLFPELLLQSAIAVAAGTLFFAFNKTRYAVATAAVTLVVLLGNNQTGDGAALIVPRMIDTLIGALIATVAVIGILPDWRARRLRPAAALALTTASRYLEAIGAQLDSGKRDDLAYRVARRNAHDADAALSTAVSHVLQEPGLVRGGIDAGIRFLVQSHTLLNYLSALGAHRGEGGGPEERAVFQDASARLTGQLDALAQALRTEDPTQLTAERDRLALALAEQLEAREDATALAQLALVSRQMPPLQKAVARLAGPAPAAAQARRR